MRSRVGLVCLVVGLLAALAAAAPAAAAPRVCVYTQERNVLGGALTGDAFVQLLPDSGPDQGKRNLLHGLGLQGGQGGGHEAAAGRGARHWGL
ncbi:MAG TPA: hypothetical protein VH231_09475 [Solirubrobacteraceae bacterium]|jgi:hypothetical protein|nr:hypothetical protein [Solirubrobacteraceae bacterium]